MAVNIQEFTVTQGGVAQVNVPTIVITAQVEEDGVIIADYTGDNALIFPNVFATLSADQRMALMNEGGIAQQVVRMKAGLET